MPTENMFLENEGADSEMGCHDISEPEHRFLKRREGRFGNSGRRDHRIRAKAKDSPIMMETETKGALPEFKAMPTM